MAKKTKNPSRSLDHDAAIQEAIFAVGEAQAFAQASIFEAEAAIREIRGTQEALSTAASRLRSLLKGRPSDSIVESRSSPHPRPSRKPAVRRKVLRRTVSRTSRPRTRQSKVGKGKRVAPKLAQYERLPWYPQGYNY